MMGMDEQTYLRIMNRLFLESEEILGDDFVKINQGCIVKVNAVKRFEASVGGAIKIILGNGFEDYISRRELSKVKILFLLYRFNDY